MTIQEAIKSGKPFKRIIFSDYKWLFVNGAIICDLLSGQQIHIDAVDILAKDWEIKDIL